MSNSIERNSIVALKQTDKRRTDLMKEVSTGKLNLQGAEAAVVSKLTMTTKTLEAAISNGQRALAFGGIIDGGLSSIADNIIAIKQMVENAASDTFDSSDRAKAQEDIQTLINSIDQIVQTARFGNTQLLSGTNAASATASATSGTFSFQIGENVLDNTNLTLYSDSPVYTINGATASGVFNTTNQNATAASTSVTDFISFQLNNNGPTYVTSVGQNIGTGMTSVKFELAANQTTPAPSALPGVTAFTVNLSTAPTASTLTALNTALGITTSNTVNALGSKGFNTINLGIQDPTTGELKAGSSLNTINVAQASASDVRSALAVCDAALEMVNQGRAAVGAFMINMESVVDLNLVKSQNLEDALDVLENIDQAQASAELSELSSQYDIIIDMISKASDSRDSLLKLFR